MTRLRLKHLDGKWWIVGLEPPHGPYDTRSEAEDDKAGLERFYEEWESMNDMPLFGGVK
jgi:hypothetical protein